MSTLFRYWHTLKYLKPVQVYSRARLLFPKKYPKLSNPPVLRKNRGGWVIYAERSPHMTSENEFNFLNLSGVVSSPELWNDPKRVKLWLYNLHYFDDLNAKDYPKRTDWHKKLIARWIEENPLGKGVGWEPYPTSLRIVNWIKWTLDGNLLEQAWRGNLALQAAWLNDRLEYHLLGNHLFANAKALVFAGLYFDGAEAEKWLTRGLAILEKEIPEQILPDGGHFERSPMYHSLILEDILDLINIFRIYGLENEAKRLEPLSCRMLAWLRDMSHPDGDISFFNDATKGIAYSFSQLEEYSLALGLAGNNSSKDGVTVLHPSGYVRVQTAAAVALLDVAPIGPDYIPGHAHADTLSYELSLYGQRVIVNSGISEYGISPARIAQRGTAAHNTVSVDRQDSSEVWSSFRVARRAYPAGLSCKEEGENLLVTCSHNGFLRLPGKPMHFRKWRVTKNGFVVSDRIEGGFKEAVSWVYFSPNVSASLFGKDGVIELPGGKKVLFNLAGGSGSILDSEYYPGFGEAVRNKCLRIQFDGSDIRFSLNWD